MKIGNLLNVDFKSLVIKILNNLRENLKKKIENIKMEILIINHNL